MAIVFSPIAEPTIAGFSDEATARVRRADFEGGYSQRSSLGPNSIARMVPLQWEVPDAAKSYIVDFFRARGGVEAFQYQLPWDDRPYLWTAEAWTCVPIGKKGAATFWRLRTTLRQEFDIQ